MRALTYFIACTADGFIARADGAYDFFLFDGDHIAAQIAEYPETMPGGARQALGIDVPNQHFDTVLMGRRTYEVGLPLGVTSPYPHLRQYVFSRSSAPASPDVFQVRDDAVGTVRRLKEESGLGIWLCGGGALASALASEIDEVVLKVHPVILGCGIPLFETGTSTSRETRLQLVSSRAYTTGVLIQHYRVMKAGVRT